MQRLGEPAPSTSSRSSPQRLAQPARPRCRVAGLGAGMGGIATDLAGSAAILLGFSAGSQCLVPPTVVGATGAGMVGKCKGALGELHTLRAEDRHE